MGEQFAKIWKDNLIKYGRRTNMKFYIVDAFTDQLFGGNTAGVVILEEGQKFPAEEVMKKTAAELRYSETAFVMVTGKENFRIKYFTPAGEVDLCGHATIGSFGALVEGGFIKGCGKYMVETLAGSLNVTVDNGFIMMDMATPIKMAELDTVEKREEISRVMRISSNLLERNPQIISTGLPDIIMEVSGREALFSIAPDFQALAKLSDKYGVVGIHAFCLADREKSVNGEMPVAHCRNFAPLFGIDEEAATGTANGALALYLYNHGIIKEEEKVIFAQGESMGRPSEIVARLSNSNANSINGNVENKNENIKIQVGGSCVVVAQGEIFI